MEEALTTLLRGSSALTASVGNRINWGRMPKGASPPYVVLNKVSGVPDYSMSGGSGLVASRVQADIYGPTAGVVRDIARALIARVSGYRGAIGAAVIQAIFVDSERELPASDAGEVTDLFRVEIDLVINHG